MWGKTTTVIWEPYDENDDDDYHIMILTKGCRLISYDIMIGQLNTTMTVVMTIRRDDAIWYSVMIDCKGDENTRQMMIMIMVIIMILIILSNHGDDDGDHSNIARLLLIDAIDGGDW